MNKLDVLREKKAPGGEVLAAINALGEYTVRHFADEEACMARIRYPGIAVHKTVHKQLLAKFTGYQQALPEQWRADRRFLHVPQDVAERAHLVGRHEVLAARGCERQVRLTQGDGAILSSMPSASSVMA